MPKQKRPNKTPAAPGPAPVLRGNVFHAFIAEAMSLGNEVEGRRALDNDFSEYLVLRGLADDFNAWRTAKHAPKG